MRQLFIALWMSWFCVPWLCDGAEVSRTATSEYRTFRGAIASLQFAKVSPGRVRAVIESHSGPLLVRWQVFDAGVAGGAELVLLYNSASEEIRWPFEVLTVSGTGHSLIPGGECPTPSGRGVVRERS